jgi:hypothetical protein
MKQKIKYVFLICVSIYSTQNIAQIDVHSQYYFNELMLNPAMTGLVENKWRLQHFRRYEMFDDFNAQNSTFAADFNVAFSKNVSEFGLNIKEYSGVMMGVGVIDNRIQHDLETDKYRSNHISLALHTMTKNKSYYSLAIQPGFLRMYDERMYDVNVGFMFGKNYIECWSEDQYYKFQLGVSAYNLFSDFRTNDSSYFPGKRIQAHAGYLFEEPKHFNIFANSALWYDSQTHFSIGANVLFFPIVHYKYFDRGRLGLHYRTSNHLVFSAGCRLYGKGQNTLSIDAQISYDFQMKFLDLEPSFTRGLELGIIITPLKKCWSLSRC